MTGKYVLHIPVAVRMYPFYGYFDAYMTGMTIYIYFLYDFHQPNTCIRFIIL